MSKNPSAADLQRISELRCRGALEEAVQALNALQLTQFSPSEFIAETLKVAMLVGQFEVAHGYALALQLRGDGEAACEPEWLTRLALERGSDPPDAANARITSRWLETFRETGIDETFPGAIEQIATRSRNGANYFALDVACPSCEARFTLNIAINLLFHKVQLCPCCCAKLRVTSRDVRSYLEAHAQPLAHDDGRGDAWILGMLRDLGQPGSDASPYPRLAQYLYQDYLYFLTEHLVVSDAQAKEGFNR